ncbi:uncharacterized protein PV07_07543 [Cladophialophora immunda]|uniref:Ammonium transporter AmtB-like domain-containing protein n=1 Tax=Cladophialophora immunda TaxID=569365 RepID=A0A0D2ARV2_9EURO|nr:uncharacterized protein PV07_07543 [Cladophialophora immunda]KIW27842.1 hypothetical protein PV07_07543 [Cladophialophora immunda]OQV02998.1 hypothetical protein CLAIMM_08103 [Cladophialophora immunda]
MLAAELIYEPLSWAGYCHNSCPHLHVRRTKQDMANDEVFNFGPVPATPRLNVTVTYDELKSHPELYFQGADMGFMIIAAALVFFMIPGLCLHFSGVSKQDFTLTLVRLPLITTGVVGCVWYMWGYTLAFSPAIYDAAALQGVSWYGGDTKANAYIDVTARPVGIQGPNPLVLTGPKIPEMVYVFYQGMFACFTASLVSGGAAGKSRVGRYLLFITLWTTLVYCPVARWTWHPLGWSKLRGAMDFAGGTAVHVCSGSSVAALAAISQLNAANWQTTVVLRKRTVKIDLKTWKVWKWLSVERHTTRNQVELMVTPPVAEVVANGHARAPRQQNPQERPRAGLDREKSSLPYSINHTVLGTCLLWVGWFGFNGGSALGANLRAVSACLATQAAACAGGTIGLLFHWGLGILDKKFEAAMLAPLIHIPSVQEFCDGVIAGLVAITPAAGYVPVKYAPIFGVVGAILCSILRKIMYIVLPADKLAIFAVHAGGGATGMLLTAFFADDATTGLDGYSRLVDKTMGARFRDQALDITACLFYSFSMTFTIRMAMKFVEVLCGVETPAHDDKYDHYPDTYEARPQFKRRNSLEEA